MPFAQLMSSLRDSAPQRRREREATIADNYRRSLGLPLSVTDGEIISLWHEMAGFDEDEILAAMREQFTTINA